MLCALMDEACIEIIRKRNFGLANQMRNAAISIVSNISEGFDRRSAPSFRYFLLVAKGSVAELRAQLYLCEDRAYLEPTTLSSLQEKATTVSRMLWGLIRYLEHMPAPSTTPKRGTRNYLSTALIARPSSRSEGFTASNLARVGAMSTVLTESR